MKQSHTEYGHLAVVGLGPGDARCLTPEVHLALQKAQCIAGYHRYISLLPKDLLATKTIIATGMREERTRAKEAIAKSLLGFNTVLVASGDPGIYALASLVLELLAQEDLLEHIPVSILPGVPALAACAALLGAPISHDFACISLSDLLTPKETIIHRVEHALLADFVLVLYNPRSLKRTELLEEVFTRARKIRKATCPVGIVRNAYRTDQSVVLKTLANVETKEVDMLSLVFIGNSQSKYLSSYFVTPRGYRL